MKVTTPQTIWARGSYGRRPAPLSTSSLKVNNRSFRQTSPCLWNQLHKELRLPTDDEDLSLSSDLTHVSSSFFSSPLSSSITPHFHSRHKSHLFHKSFPPNQIFFEPKLELRRKPQGDDTLPPSKTPLTTCPPLTWGCTILLSCTI